MIGSILKSELPHLNDEFNLNALAYLSLTSKNEHVLCGALANRLQMTLSDQQEMLVGREWQTVDIAVLSQGEPVALIEAKAAYTFNLKVTYPSKEVTQDVAKLRSKKFKGECERYVLTFFTHPNQLPQGQIDTVLKYSDRIRRHGVLTEAEIHRGFKRFHERIGQIPLVTNGEIRAGHAFGIDVSVFYWLFDANTPQTG